MAQDYTLQAERLYTYDHISGEFCNEWQTCLITIESNVLDRKSKKISDCRKCSGSKSLCQGLEETYYPSANKHNPIVDYECIDEKWLSIQAPPFDVGKSFALQAEQFADGMTSVHKYFWPKFP